MRGTKRDFSLTFFWPKPNGLTLRRLKMNLLHLNQYKCCILPNRKFYGLSESAILFFITPTRRRTVTLL